MLASGSTPVFWPQNIPARAVGLGTSTRLTQESVVYATSSWTYFNGWATFLSQKPITISLGDCITPWLRTPSKIIYDLIRLCGRPCKQLKPVPRWRFQRPNNVVMVTVTKLYRFLAGSKVCTNWHQHETTHFFRVSLALVGAPCSSASRRRCRASTTPSFSRIECTSFYFKCHAGRETNPRGFGKSIYHDSILYRMI